MFDIGGWEFLVIIVIAVIVIGPKDIPGTIRTVTGWIRRARELARDFQSGLDDLAREAELDDVKNELRSGMGIDEVRDAGQSLRHEIEHSIDPGHEIENSFRDDGTPLSDRYPPEEDEEPDAPERRHGGIADSDSVPATPADEPASDGAEAEPAAEEPAGAPRKA